MAVGKFRLRQTLNGIIYISRDFVERFFVFHVKLFDLNIC